jgi:hypothetical protein
MTAPVGEETLNRVRLAEAHVVVPCGTQLVHVLTIGLGADDCGDAVEVT